MTPLISPRHQACLHLRCIGASCVKGHFTRVPFYVRGLLRALSAR